MCVRGIDFISAILFYWILKTVLTVLYILFLFSDALHFMGHINVRPSTPLKSYDRICSYFVGLLVMTYR